MTTKKFDQEADPVLDAAIEERLKKRELKPLSEEEQAAKDKEDAELAALVEKQTAELMERLELEPFEIDPETEIHMDKRAYGFAMGIINEQRHRASAYTNIFMKTIAETYSKVRAEAGIDDGEYETDANNKIFVIVASNFCRQHAQELLDIIEPENVDEIDAFKRGLTIISHVTGAAIKKEHELLDLVTVQVLNEMSLSLQRSYRKIAAGETEPTETAKAADSESIGDSEPTQ